MGLSWFGGYNRDLKLEKTFNAIQSLLSQWGGNLFSWDRDPEIVKTDIKILTLSLILFIDCHLDLKINELLSWFFFSKSGISSLAFVHGRKEITSRHTPGQNVVCCSKHMPANSRKRPRNISQGVSHHQSRDGCPSNNPSRWLPASSLQLSIVDDQPVIIVVLLIMVAAEFDFFCAKDPVNCRHDTEC